MNLGITLSTPPSRAVSITDVYSAYIDMQAVTDEIGDDLQQITALSVAMSNIRDIARTIKTHHSAEALAAIQNLFEDKGVTSFETLKEKARAVWNKIMSLFNAIGEKMRAAYTKYRSKYLMTIRDSGTDLAQKIANLKTNDIEFSYEGIKWSSIPSGGDINSIVYGGDDFNNVRPFSEVKPALAKLFDVKTQTVNGKADAVAAVKACGEFAGSSGATYEHTWREYYKARSEMREAYSDNDVARAKKRLDRETNRMKAHVYISRVYLRTACSIFSHALNAYGQAFRKETK